MDSMGVREKKSFPRWYGWVVLSVVWLAAFTAPANMVKVTALAAPIMEWFAIDEASVSWVMSMFYIMGCVFAFPAAGIVGKLGVRKTVLFAIVFEIVGGFMGLMCGHSLPVFMVSRAVEGVSFGLLTVAGIPAISAWFPPEKRGMPMGVWGIVVAVSFIIGPLLFAGIYDALLAWQPVWWFNIAMDAVFLILFLALYRDARFSFDGEGNRIADSDSLQEGSFGKGAISLAFKTPAVVCASVAMLFMCGAQMAIENFLPTYIFTELDASLTMANLIASGGAVFGVVFSLILGKLSDVTGKTKLILCITVLFGLVYAWIAFETTSLGVYVFIIVCIGIAEGGGPAMIFTILAKNCPDRAMAAGSALIAFTQNLGMLVGTTLIGSVVSGLGWAVGAHVVAVPLYVLVLIVVLAFWKKIK